MMVKYTNFYKLLIKNRNVWHWTKLKQHTIRNGGNISLEFVLPDKHNLRRAGLGTYPPSRMQVLTLTYALETRQQRSFYKYHARRCLDLHHSKDPSIKDFSSLSLSLARALLTTHNTVSISPPPSHQRIKQALTHRTHKLKPKLAAG